MAEKSEYEREIEELEVRGARCLKELRKELRKVLTAVDQALVDDRKVTNIFDQKDLEDLTRLSERVRHMLS